MALELRQSRGYRRLCSLWFEYDLCLNRKLPNDLESFLTTLIRIRSVDRTKGVKLGFEYDHVAPSGFGVAPTKSVPTAMFSLVQIRPMFEQEAPK